MPSLTLTAISQAARNRRQRTKAPRVGADKGINKKDLPTLISPEQALSFKGAWNIGVAKTEKVPGFKQVANSGSVVNNFIGKLTDNLYVLCYGTTGALWNLTTNIITTFKADFTTSDDFSGVRYGTYYYLCNGGDKIGYVDTSGVWTSIAAAPKAKHLALFQTRLLAGNTDTDESQLHASKVDSGTGVFDDWTIGADDGDSFSSINPRMGALNGIGQIGNQVVIIRDDGKVGFHLEYFDVSGTGLQQDVRIDFEKTDLGGYRGVISTSSGVYYVNAYGLWRLQGGEDDKVFEKQATNLLADYVKEFNFRDADIVYMPVEEKILVTCKKNDPDNNDTVIFLDINNDAIGEIPGWNIKRFLRDGEKLYGTSSINGDVFELLSGYDSNGTNTTFEIEGREEDFNNEEVLKDMFNFYIYGRMSLNSSATIEIDTWDEAGNKTTTYKTLTWTSDIASIEPVKGHSKLGMSKPRRFASEATQAVKGHVKLRIKAFTKIKFRVKESSMYPFELNKIVPDGIVFGRQVRKHNLAIS